jgi:hypothetical protein
MNFEIFYFIYYLLESNLGRIGPKKKENRILKEKGNISNLQKQVLKPNWSTKLFANSLSVSLCVCKSSDISSSFYFLRIRFFLFLNLLFPFFSLFLGSSLYLTLLETSKTTKKITDLSFFAFLTWVSFFLFLLTSYISSS